MTKVLGKRKARSAEDKTALDPENAQEIFRRHFETQFKPLAVEPIRPLPPTVEAEDDEDPGSEAEDSEWGGISEDEDDENNNNGVEIVDHASSQKPVSSMSKAELKKFMSSRTPTSDSPSSTPRPAPSATSSTALEEDAPSLLANDLALQRLLSESSLLSKATPNPMFYPSSSTSSNGRTGADQQQHPSARPFAAGKLRLATADLRLRALGSKESLFVQKKMPMGMRRGIEAAARGREERRRREAKENGIVLEREEKKPDSRSRRRGPGERGGDVDAPAVGRLRGAQLTLSRRDIADIQGTGGGGTSGGSRGGKGGGGGGGGRGGKRRR